MLSIAILTCEVEYMRVTRAEAARNRERIIDEAARLFRERGFDGIGVADLMKSAGLTHGGFYRNFESKEDLMVQACARAMEESLQNWDSLGEAGTEADLSAIASVYLSPKHRDRPGRGCSLAALGAEAARHGPVVRGVFTRGVRSTLETLSRLVPGRSKRLKRENAIAAFSSMVGALMLARVVDDEKLSNEILRSVKTSIGRIDSTQ